MRQLFLIISSLITANNPNILRILVIFWFFALNITSISLIFLPGYDLAKRGTAWSPVVSLVIYWFWRLSPRQNWPHYSWVILNISPTIHGFNGLNFVELTFVKEKLQELVLLIPLNLWNIRQYPMLFFGESKKKRKEPSYDGSFLVKKTDLALSYFPAWLPKEYLRSYNVSLSSSGWGRSGSIVLEAPGSLSYSIRLDQTFKTA